MSHKSMNTKLYVLVLHGQLQLVLFKISFFLMYILHNSANVIKDTAIDKKTRYTRIIQHVLQISKHENLLGKQNYSIIN